MPFDVFELSNKSQNFKASFWFANSASPQFLLDAGGFSTGAKPQFSTILGFATDLMQCFDLIEPLEDFAMQTICMFTRCPKNIELSSQILPLRRCRQLDQKKTRNVSKVCLCSESSDRVESLVPLQSRGPVYFNIFRLVQGLLKNMVRCFSLICKISSNSLAISWPVPPQSEPLQQFHHLAPCHFWSQTAATTITTYYNNKQR